jgi:hypothetical protein
VSNKCMRQLNRKQKMLGFLALAVLGLLLAPFATVQIQERIFRHRAEQLLADIRTIELHKASPTQLRAIFDRWNSGPCSEQHCELEADVSYSFLQSGPTGFPGLCLHIFRFFGGHLARVRAQAVEQTGGVWDTWFGVDIENPSGRDPNGWDFSNMLSGVVYSVSRFSLQNDWGGLTLHPDYIISIRPPMSDDAPPPTLVVTFDPQCNPADIARLTTIDLSCLTRLTPCRKPEDIMPQAAAQFAKEELQLAQARKNQVCSPDMLALMARDAGRAGVVEMTGSRVEPHSSDIPVPVVRLVQDFKPAPDWKTGESHELLILDANTGGRVPKLPPEVYPGNRFIMLAERDFVFGLVQTDRCGIVPLNPANLELVRQAIAGNLPPTKP